MLVDMVAESLQQLAGDPMEPIVDMLWPSADERWAISAWARRWSSEGTSRGSVTARFVAFDGGMMRYGDQSVSQALNINCASNTEPAFRTQIQIKLTSLGSALKG